MRLTRQKSTRLRAREEASSLSRLKFTRRLKDEAVRRAHDRVVKLVLYKGKPVTYQGQLIYEHEYSDHLMIKLLEAGDPDQFNRQRVAPFDAESLNLENLTRGQTQQLMEWLKKLGVSCARAGWRHSAPDRVRAQPLHSR